TGRGPGLATLHRRPRRHARHRPLRCLRPGRGAAARIRLYRGKRGAAGEGLAAALTVTRSPANAKACAIASAGLVPMRAGSSGSEQRDVFGLVWMAKPLPISRPAAHLVRAWNAVIAQPVLTLALPFDDVRLDDVRVVDVLDHRHAAVVGRAGISLDLASR